MSSSPPIPPNRTTEGNTENMTANTTNNNNNNNNNNNSNSKPPPPPLPRRNLPTPPTTSSTTTAATSTTTTTNMIDSTTTTTTTVPTATSNSSISSISKKIESLYEGVVIRNYHAEEDDELTVNIHDTVQVIKEFDDGWLLCQLILSRKNHHHSNSATTENNNNINVASAYVRALERRKQQKTLGLVPKEHVERAEFCSSISNTKVRVPIRKGSVHVIKQKLDLEAVFNNKNQQQQQQQPIVPPTTSSNNNTNTFLPNSPPSTPPLTPPSSAKRDSTNNSNNNNSNNSNNSNNNTNETASIIAKTSSKGNIFSSLLSKKKSLNSIQMSSAIHNNTNDSNSNSNSNSNNNSNSSTPPPVPTNKPVRPSSMESAQQQQQKSPTSISSPRERDANMNNLSRIVMMNPRPSSSPAAPSSSSSSQESISSPSATSSTSSVDLSLNTLMSSADVQSCSTHGDDSNSSSTCTTPMSPNDSSSSSSNTESSMSSTSLTLPDQQMQQMQQLIENHIARREGKTEQIREMQTKRKQIRMEILETEQTYVHCLTLQRNMFAKLIKMLKLVPDDVYKLLFPTSLDIIYDINVSFLDYLKKVITTMPSMAFGAEQMRTLMSKMSLESSEMTDEIKNQCLEGALKEVSMINDAGNGSSINSNPTAAPSAPKGNFEIDPYQSQSTQLASLILHYAHTFKLYTDYINKYPIVISTLMQEKARNKKFAEFLHHQRILLQQQGERCCMLEDFLITPIQRLPRYRLLFEDLMKKTEPEHGSYETLEMAVNLITDIAKFCNDKEEEHLNQIAMATLLKRYKLKEFLQPGRRILMRFESQTDVQYMKSKGSRGECDLYLLSDAILVAKSKNSLSNKKNTLRIQLTKIGTQLDKKGTACAVQLSPPVQMKLDHQLFYSFQVVTNYVPLGSDLNSSSTSKPQKITLLWKCQTTMTKAYQAIQSIQPNIGS